MQHTGRVQNHISVSTLVLSLFMFSVSSCFSLGRLFISKNLSSFSRLSILLACCSQLLAIVSYDSFYFQGVCRNFLFIYLFISLSPLPFFLDESGQKFIIFVYLLKEPLPVSLSFLYHFLPFCFIYFCPDLSGFFPSATLSFACSFSGPFSITSGFLRSVIFLPS